MSVHRTGSRLVSPAPKMWQNCRMWVGGQGPVQYGHQSDGGGGGGGGDFRSLDVGESRSQCKDCDELLCLAGGCSALPFECFGVDVTQWLFLGSAFASLCRT